MVVDAVCGEPVSGSNSLHSGNLSGISGTFAPFLLDAAKITTKYPTLSEKFPKLRNRELNQPNRESILLNREAF